LLLLQLTSAVFVASVSAGAAGSETDGSQLMMRVKSAQQDSGNTAAHMLSIKHPHIVQALHMSGIAYYRAVVLGATQTRLKLSWAKQQMSAAAVASAASHASPYSSVRVIVPDRKLDPKNFLKLPASRCLMLQPLRWKAELDKGVLPLYSLPDSEIQNYCRVCPISHRSLTLLRGKATGAVR
jgi:hypothetical protein